MKKLISSALMAIAVAAGMAADIKIDRVEPPYWWTGMENDTLQIMLTGKEVGLAEASLSYPGVNLLEQVSLENPDYLILYLTVGKDAAPGSFPISLADGKRRGKLTYTLRQRKEGSASRKGFDSSDVLYLVMPDRFASDGRDPREGVKSLEYPVMPDRSNPNGRHGGNIGGLRKHLDYIDSLGVTAVWVCPVLENDMPGGSYHGYATTDYYRIDPRFGTNDEWRGFIDDAHSRGIKVVMDMIFNHSGSNHPWLRNMPAEDWISNGGEYVQTNHKLSTVYDPYRSDYDYDRAVNGWFVESMPDLNQRNPHLMRYLTQNSIWWIEDAGIDGIRMDTHPYADMQGMASWLDDVRREYPGFNIVGECWLPNEGAEAFWQKGSYVNHQTDPGLETVMDFAFMTKCRDAFNEPTGSWGGGLNTIYDHLALDFLFPDPSNILTFLDNHDSDRFLLSEPENLNAWRQAVAFLLTSRGIPQIYYGTELLMNGSKEGSDGYIRLDMPGGFPGDDPGIDVFSGKGMTEKQREAFDFISRLLHWRRGNDVVAKGTLKHFVPSQGVYVYERKLGGRQVIVIMNGRDEAVEMDMEQTAEVLPFGTTYTDILSSSPLTVTPRMTLPPRALYILENR